MSAITWLSWIEQPLARIGKLDQLSVVIALGTLGLTAYTLGTSADTHQHDRISTVLLSGVLGLATYLLVNGLGELFDEAGDGVALALMFSRVPFYDFYTHAPRLIEGFTALIDQTIAGAVLMIFGKVSMGIAAAVIFYRWFGAEHRADRAIESRIRMR